MILPGESWLAGTANRALKRLTVLGRFGAPVALVILAGTGGDNALERHTKGSENSAQRLDLSSVPLTVINAADAPFEFLDLPRDQAREINLAIPFSTAPNPAARPYIHSGDPISRARARDCLAAAQYYEAGRDIEGQRAVAQVVLNRARHPAYPASICEVVFQGAERATGCQFTFTCDGAMARRPLPDLWKRAQEIAGEALDGAVYAKVGLATHYHTDWVVPYWSGELEKITNVRTHLFFRWPGSWGRPAAFRRATASSEPVEARLAMFSANHAPLTKEEELSDQALARLDPEYDRVYPPAVRGAGARLPDLPGVNMRGAELRLAHPQGDAYGFLVKSDYPGSYGLLAYDVCRGRQFCKIMGWTQRQDIPTGFPISQLAQSQMVFYYLYDRPNRREIMAWDCDLFPRDKPSECITAETTRWDAS